MSPVKALLFTWAIAATPMVPELPERPPTQEGPCEATVYGFGTRWHGDTKANGDPFRPRAEVSVAHKSIPLGTTILVESTTTGRAIWATVEDRGPYVITTPDGRDRAVDARYEPTGGEQWTRCLDLSIAAAKALGGVRIHQVRLRYWEHSHSDPMAWRTD